jgi:hypothetical protein
VVTGQAAVGHGPRRAATGNHTCRRIVATIMSPTSSHRSTSPGCRRRGRSRHRPRFGRTGAILGTAALVLGGCELAGSGAPDAHTSVRPPDELAGADARPCPQELPVGDDPSGHGFGVDRDADEAPALPGSREVWVCRYDAFDVGTTTQGGTVSGWRRAGRPEPVAAARLPGLAIALGGLTTPADPGGACTADLGPRWLVVQRHDGDLTGVLVDDFGCRDVRLTDDPHVTPPGAEDQEGAVSGVLDGGAAILDALGVGRPS